MNGSLGLNRVGAVGTALGFREVFSVDGCDLAVRIFFYRGGLNDVGVTQTNGHCRFVSSCQCQAAIAFGRFFREVASFNPKFFSEGKLARAAFQMLRVIGRLEFFDLIFRIVINDEFDRILNGDTTIGFSIKHISQRTFENRVVDPAAGLFRNPDAITEQTHGFGRIAAAAQTDESRHAGVVPTIDEAFFDQGDQFAFAHDHISQIQTIELVLMRKQEEVRFNGCA